MFVQTLIRKNTEILFSNHVIMKRKILFPGVCLLALIFFNACSSDDDLGYNPAEADIYEVSLKGLADVLQGDPVIDNDQVTIRLKDTLESYKLTPEFTISQGATINPENGSEVDLSKPQKYVVTSEDGNKHEYTVQIIIDNHISYVFSFEDVEESAEEKENAYHRFVEDEQGRQDWASGNDGFSILAPSLAEQEGEEISPKFYPTAQTDNGYQGKAAKLQTKSTGALGEMFGSPMAAGNLFIGHFDGEQAIGDAMGATQFGLPYNAKNAPLELTGYFKYKKGEDFETNAENTELNEDVWDAYALLFERSEDENYLRGDHNFEDSRIVATARLDTEQAIETDEWTEFSIPFEFEEGKAFDLSKDYMYTIVFSASKEGAVFNGAVGSTLWIDEVELVTETDD